MELLGYPSINQKTWGRKKLRRYLRLTWECSLCGAQRSLNYVSTQPWNCSWCARHWDSTGWCRWGWNQWCFRHCNTYGGAAGILRERKTLSHFVRHTSHQLIQNSWRERERLWCTRSCMWNRQSLISANDRGWAQGIRGRLYSCTPGLPSGRFTFGCYCNRLCRRIALMAWTLRRHTESGKKGKTQQILPKQNEGSKIRRLNVPVKGKKNKINGMEQLTQSYLALKV